MLPRSISVIFGYGLGLLGFVLRGDELWKLLMMVALGTAGILVVWHREFIKRPKEVIVSSEGLVLRFRYGMREKTVS
jgi:hypothetical protein